jgi:hypothetical protein
MGWFEWRADPSKADQVTQKQRAVGITVHRWKEIYLNVKSIRKKGYERRRDYAKLRVTFEPRGV